MTSTTSNRSEALSNGNGGSQRWEDIVLSNNDEGPEIQDTESSNTKKCGLNELTLDFVRESAQLVQEATPDFINNISSLLLFSLLSFLVLRGNGLEDLRPFLSLSCIWLTSTVGGYVIRFFHLPPLLGMITASVIITNSSDFIAIPDSWGETITSSGLAIILLLSGLDLDIRKLQSSQSIAMRLTCVPGVVEAITSGLLTVLIFGMPLWLGLSLGFILAAVSPALVVVGMLKLQRQRFGIAKGIPSLIIAAASFDDIVAITGFSFFIGLAIQSQHSSVLYSVLHGPLELCLGFVSGVTSGMIISITKIWKSAWKRTVITVLLVLCLMFSLKSLKYAGAGAMGSLITGIVASNNWENGVPGKLSIGPSEEFTKSTESHVSTLWSIIFEPLLFGYIGTAIDFKLLQGSAAKSILVLVVGLCFRLVAAYSCTGGDKFTPKERAFISLVWMPKATVQAALCSFPLMLAKDVMSTDHEDYEQYIEWGNQILSTAILSIIITAPAGLICMQHLGPKWLTKDDEVPNDTNHDFDQTQNNNETGSKQEADEMMQHISRMDVLLKKISLSSSHVETSCILAESRQVLWKCKSILKMKSIESERA